MNPKAVILAGGKGTRLRPFSFTIPKPLMPIGEDPILLHLINQFKESGVGHFLIALGYQSELIKAYFGDGSRFGVTIDYFLESEPMGTAGPLSMMREQFAKDEYFFVANGDIHTELNFQDMLDFARNQSAELTIGCKEICERSSFGVIHQDQGAVSSIVEKPEHRYSINTGIYVVKESALARIPDHSFFTMPQLAESYLSEGQKVGAYMIEEFWLGIENVENLETVMQRIQRKRELSADVLSASEALSRAKNNHHRNQQPGAGTP